MRRAGLGSQPDVTEPQSMDRTMDNRQVVPLRLARRQFLVAIVAALIGWWLWPGEVGEVVGWQARLAALFWLFASIGLVGACFWVVVGLVDGQWSSSGFRPGRWMAGNKRRR